MRILVSGGGTAGHVSPTLATLDALKSHVKPLEVLYVGQSGDLERRLVEAAGWRFAVISAGKWRRYQNVTGIRRWLDLPTQWRNLLDLSRVARGVWQSRGLIRDFKPQVIFIKGGFVGLPVGLAARWLKIPFLIHESDVMPGVTNRILSRWAARVAVGFPVDKYKSLPPDKLLFVGNPVRPAIARAHRLEGIGLFKLNPDRPIVLIWGGSQGSRALNGVVVRALPSLLPKMQIIHVTGEQELEAVKFEVSRLAGDLPGYQVHAFLGSDLGPALAAADVVVSRAGANSLAELAILKKPTVLIPHPNLEHQIANAQVLARAGAAKVIQEPKLTPALLQREIESIIGSEREQLMLARGIAQLAQPDAAERLAAELVALALPEVKDE